MSEPQESLTTDLGAYSLDDEDQLQPGDTLDDDDVDVDGEEEEVIEAGPRRSRWGWTPPPLFDATGKCMASYLTMTAAHVNNVFIAAANRIGQEQDARYLGCSLIAGTNGWPIGEVAPADKQIILYADIDLSTARSAPIWNNLNDLHRDRRADLYDQMLGYRQHSCLPR